MRILLANDDGVNAPGIRSLFQELRQEDVTIVAPLEERSTTGHSLSLDKPLRMEKLEDRIYGCSGFPGDCVLMAIGHLLKEERPDLVVSGINRGANLGQDLYYSGTIAAAREAAFHGIPSIAVSLVFNHVTDEHLYSTAARFINECIKEGLHQHIPPMALLNINVPNVPWNILKGCKLTQLGFRKYSEEIHARVDSRNREYYWIAGLYQGHNQDPLSDCQAVQDGYVALTLQRLVDGIDINHTSLITAIARVNAKMLG